MAHTIDVPDNETIIYNHEIKTAYDNVIMTFDVNQDHGICHFTKCSIFRMPNTLIYHYIGPISSRSLTDFVILCDEHICLYYHDANGGTNKYSICIMNMQSGIILLEKKCNNNRSVITSTEFERTNYILLCYHDGQNYCTEIFDESFVPIHKYCGGGNTITKWGINSFQNNSIKSIMHYSGVITEIIKQNKSTISTYVFDSNAISENYVALCNNTHIRVYDFVNRKIILDCNEKKRIEFIRWKNNSIIYKIGNTFKIREINNKNDNKDLCVVCLLSIDEKHVIIPCGHTQICSDCIQRITLCPICKINITSTLKLL